jgi:hypothetical protein
MQQKLAGTKLAGPSNLGVGGMQDLRTLMGSMFSRMYATEGSRA